MIRAGIYGATGYTGWELVKILQRHPAAEIAFVATRSQAGKTLRELFPAAPRLPLVAGADAPRPTPANQAPLSRTSPARWRCPRRRWSAPPASRRA